jgi:hypothetical protein
VYRKDEFIQQISQGNPESIEASCETCLYDPVSGKWEVLSIMNLSVQYGVNGFNSYWDLPSSFSGSTFAAVFSDGITQIKDVDWKDAVFQFMNYKSTSGEFVKRRMMKALKTMTPMDDISCAAIRITQDADNETDAIDA